MDAFELYRRLEATLAVWAKAYLAAKKKKTNNMEVFDLINQLEEIREHYRKLQGEIKEKRDLGTATRNVWGA